MGGTFASGFAQGLEQSRDRAIQAEQLKLHQEMTKSQLKAMETEDQLRQLSLHQFMQKMAFQDRAPSLMANITGAQAGQMNAGGQGPMPQAPPEIDRSKLASFLQSAAQNGQDPMQLLQLMSVGDPRIASIKESLMPPEIKEVPAGGTLVEIRRGQQAQQQASKAGTSSTYDYEAAKRNGIKPEPYAHEKGIDPSTGQPYLHMDSRFKMDNDPRRFLRSELGIFDTKYSVIVPPEQFAKEATPEQKKTLLEAERLPAAETQGYIDEALKNPQEQPIRGTQTLKKESDQAYQANLERQQALDMSAKTGASDVPVDFIGLSQRNPPPADFGTGGIPQPQAPAAPPQPQPMGSQVRVLAQGSPKPSENKPLVVPQGSSVIDPHTGQPMFQAPPKPFDFGDRAESAAAAYSELVYGRQMSLSDLIKIDPIAGKKVRDQAFVGEPTTIAAAKLEATIPLHQKELLNPEEANKLGVPYGTTKEEAKGLLPLSAQQRESLAGFDAARVLIQDIKQYSEKVNTAAGGIMGRGEQAGKLWGAWTQSDPDAAMLQSKAGELARLARSMGEKGAMAEGDIARAAALVPGIIDTKEVAIKKLKDLSAIIDHAETNFRKSLEMQKPSEPKKAPPIQPQEDPTTANIPIPKNLSPKQQEIFKQEYLKQRQKVQSEMQKGATNAAKPK